MGFGGVRYGYCGEGRNVFEIVRYCFVDMRDWKSCRFGVLLLSGKVVAMNSVVS